MHDRIFLNARVVSIGGPYWIGALRDDGAAYARGVAVDENGNFYIGGFNQTTYNFRVAKYDQSGAIQWQKSLHSGSPATEKAYSLKLDAAGNIYMCGETNANNLGFQLQIIKCNNNGVPQWQKRLDGSSDVIGYGVSVDSSGNAYACGQSESSKPIIVKYDLNGGSIWQRGLSFAGGVKGWYYAVDVDPSGNIYACGEADITSPYRSLILVKYDTSGSVIWQRRLGGVTAATHVSGYAVSASQSGDVYVGGTIIGPALMVAKYNSSGTLQWQKQVSGITMAWGGIDTDPSGNVYVSGYANISGYMEQFCIIKFDANGNIQWQRQLGGYASEISTCLSVDVSGNVYVGGYTDAWGNNDFFFAKLPSDGSLTGTYSFGLYNNVVYSATTFTVSNSVLNDQSFTASVIDPYLTNYTSSMVDATTASTSSVGIL